MAENKGEGKGPFETVVGGDKKTETVQDESGKTRVTTLGEGQEFKPGEKLGAGRRIMEYNPETGVYIVEEADGTRTQTTKPRG